MTMLSMMSIVAYFLLGYFSTIAGAVIAHQQLRLEKLEQNV